jgi:hypothetical protein
MEFLQVGELLTKAAETVLPPLFGLAAALFIFRLLDPAAFARLAAGFKRLIVHHHRLRSAREGLEPYGLGWLVPFFTLITFAAVVLTTHYFLALAGDRLPPQVNRDDAYLVPPTIDQSDRLLLVRKYPGADSYQAAYDLSVKAWDLAGKDSLDSSIDYYRRMMRMAKYLAIVALLASIFGLRRAGARVTTLARLLAVLVACAALWAAGLGCYVDGMGNAYQRRWREIRNTLRVEGYSREVPPPTAAELKKMEDGRIRPWWNISLRED